MNNEILALYCAVSFFYIISPGPAIFLAIYNGSMNGVKSVMASALGNIIGLMLLSSLSISGLSAILLASSTLFMVFKIVGASYLIFLGCKQLKSSFKKSAHSVQSPTRHHSSLLSFFREGLFVAVTNPKPILFFTALFPQFIDTSQPVFFQFIVMTLIFMLFSFLSLSTYGYLAGKASGYLAKPDTMRWFTRVSGGLFVGMGTSLFYVKNTSS